jgi:hypothetical protein
MGADTSGALNCSSDPGIVEIVHGTEEAVLGRWWAKVLSSEKFTESSVSSPQMVRFTGRMVAQLRPVNVSVAEVISAPRGTSTLVKRTPLNRWGAGG